jgi:hypothetical protein
MKVGTHSIRIFKLHQNKAFAAPCEIRDQKSSRMSRKYEKFRFWPLRAKNQKTEHSIVISIESYTRDQIFIKIGETFQICARGNCQ